MSSDNVPSELSQCGMRRYTPWLRRLLLGGQTYVLDNAKASELFEPLLNINPPRRSRLNFESVYARDVGETCYSFGRIDEEEFCVAFLDLDPASGRTTVNWIDYLDDGEARNFRDIDLGKIAGADERAAINGEIILSDFEKALAVIANDWSGWRIDLGLVIDQRSNECVRDKYSINVDPQQSIPKVFKDFLKQQINTANPEHHFTISRNLPRASAQETEIQPLTEVQRELKRVIGQRLVRPEIYPDVSRHFYPDQLQNWLTTEIFSEFESYIYGNGATSDERFRAMFRNLQNSFNRKQFNRWVYSVRIFMEVLWLSKKAAFGDSVDSREVVEFLQDRYKRIAERKNEYHCKTVNELFNDEVNYCNGLRAIRADSILNLLVVENSLDIVGDLHGFITNYYLITKPSWQGSAYIRHDPEAVADYLQLVLATDTMTRERMLFFADYVANDIAKANVLHCYFYAIRSLETARFQKLLSLGFPSVVPETGLEACESYGA